MRRSAPRSPATEVWLWGTSAPGSSSLTHQARGIQSTMTLLCSSPERWVPKYIPGLQLPNDLLGLCSKTYHHLHITFQTFNERHLPEFEHKRSFLTLEAVAWLKKRVVNIRHWLRRGQRWPEVMPWLEKDQEGHFLQIPNNIFVLIMFNGQGHGNPCLCSKFHT